MRIGIVNIEHPPLVTRSCFQTFDNLTTLTFNKADKCLKYPGLAIEIIFLLTKNLGISDYQFIPAETFGNVSSGKGLVDLVRKELVNFTVPQILITESRKRLISFSVPALFHHD